MRTLFSLLYDGLIIVSLIILLSFPIVIANHGQAVAPGDKRYSLFILTVIFGYFWFMTNLSGQTIGMKAWRLQYEASEGKSIWRGLLIRYCFYLPIIFLFPFQTNKQERVLKKLCGIGKYTLHT